MYKRYEVRKSAAVPMEVISHKSNIPLDFVTWDLSEEGAYFMTDVTPTPGEHIVCGFSLSGTPREYCFLAEVCRINRGRRINDFGPIGFGVRFLDSAPLERIDIRRTLLRLDEPVQTSRRENI